MVNSLFFALSSNERVNLLIECVKNVCFFHIKVFYSMNFKSDSFYDVGLKKVQRHKNKKCEKFQIALIDGKMLHKINELNLKFYTNQNFK